MTVLEDRLLGAMIPGRSYRFTELADLADVSRNNASKPLRSLVAQGRIERIDVVHQAFGRSDRRTRHLYRLADPTSTLPAPYQIGKEGERTSNDNGFFQAVYDALTDGQWHTEESIARRSGVEVHLVRQIVRDMELCGDTLRKPDGTGCLSDACAWRLTSWARPQNPTHVEAVREAMADGAWYTVAEIFDRVSRVLRSADELEAILTHLLARDEAEPGRIATDGDPFSDTVAWRLTGKGAE